MSDERKSHLTLYICIAIVGAILSALLVPRLAMKLEVGGEVFLSAASEVCLTQSTHVFMRRFGGKRHSFR